MVKRDPFGSGAGADFAEAFRRSVAERNVTLAWLHGRLAASGNAVSIATLSYWRSGARRPEGPQSMAAVNEIETLLHLERGTLSSLVGPTHRVGPVGAPQYPLAQAKLMKAATEAFAALGTPLPESTRDVSAQVITDVDERGFVVSRTTRVLLQAMQDTVTEVPCLELVPGTPCPAPIFRAIAGAHVVREYSHPGGEVHGVTFGLEQPLTMAQTALIEWTVEYPPGFPEMRETGYAVSRRCRELVLWTRFHREALPDWCDEVIETPSETIRHPAALFGTSLHQVHRRFGPGAVALHWGYGARE